MVCQLSGHTTCPDNEEDIYQSKESPHSLLNHLSQLVLNQSPHGSDLNLGKEHEGPAQIGVPCSLALLPLCGKEDSDPTKVCINLVSKAIHHLASGA